jgi:hypothetical protein
MFEQIKKILERCSCLHVLTSADPTLEAKAKALGAVDFIVKPADITR